VSTIITKYFKNIDKAKLNKLNALKDIYESLNAKVNLISRKDINNLYEHHILHSLAIAKIISFEANQEVLDVGSGGGFPGIPLAILFPDTKFLLVDSKGKKTAAIKQVASSLNLKNVAVEQARAEDLRVKVDWAVCRAVGRLDEVWPWVVDKIKHKSDLKFPNGLIYLKGDNYSSEVPAGVTIKEWPLRQLFPGLTYYEHKSVLLLYRR
jgi:16S rRNA (guanine527-N7)-methyltransferase